MRSTDPAAPARPSAPALRPRPSRAAVGAITAALLAFLLGGVDSERAQAVAYPSWQDVQNAKASETATAEKVVEITALVRQLEDRRATAESLARARGAELEKAQDAFEEAAQRSRELRSQADRNRADAEKARVRAGAIAAGLHRGGSADVTMSLLLSAIGGSAGGESPELLLGRLGSASQLVVASTRIFEQVRVAENTARASALQADDAQRVRESLRATAEQALASARSAATEAAESVVAEDQKAVVLRAQLAALKDTASRTVRAYQAGIEEERRRAAAAAAAAAAAGTPSDPGGGVDSQGWTRPVAGRISSPFGPRTQPCSNCTSYHRGVDIAAPSGAPIFAAASGTVVYAGPLGTYGNFVLVRHAGGVETGYAHIAPRGILVGIGAHVAAGAQIARVGMTGAATGYHLHYEVRINGAAIDPVPFMRQRGVSLG